MTKNKNSSIVIEI